MTIISFGDCLSSLVLHDIMTSDLP